MSLNTVSVWVYRIHHVQFAKCLTKCLHRYVMSWNIEYKVYPCDIVYCDIVCTYVCILVLLLSDLSSMCALQYAQCCVCHCSLCLPGCSLAAAWRAGVVPCPVWCTGSKPAGNRPGMCWTGGTDTTRPMELVCYKCVHTTTSCPAFGSRCGLVWY